MTEGVTETNSVIVAPVEPPDPRRIAALAEVLRGVESHRVATVSGIADHASWGDRSAFEALARVVVEVGTDETTWDYADQSCMEGQLAAGLVRQVDAGNPAVEAAFEWMVANREHPSPYVREHAWRGISRALHVPLLRDRAWPLIDEAAGRNEMVLRDVLLDAAKMGHEGALDALFQRDLLFDVGVIARGGGPLSTEARSRLEAAWQSGDAAARLSVVKGVVHHAARREPWPPAVRIVKEARVDPDPNISRVVANNEWLLDPRVERLDPTAWLLHTVRRAARALSPNARVKRDLESLFTDEKSFFGEYGTYTTDLQMLVFAPSNDDYAIGFCTAYPPDSKIPGICDLDTTRNGAPGGGLADPCAALAQVGLATRFEADGQSFTAFAARNVDADPDLEVWSIDQNKNVTRLTRD